VSTPEGKFKMDQRDALIVLPRSWIHVADALLKKGVPDIMGCVNERTIGLELKVDTPASQIQRVVLAKMRNAGAWTGFARKKMLLQTHTRHKYFIELSTIEGVKTHEFYDETLLAHHISVQCGEPCLMNCGFH
jgi:hypothetical protein